MRVQLIENTLGVPQQGHRRLHWASSRQARVHEAPLQRQGQRRRGLCRARSMVGGSVSGLGVLRWPHGHAAAAELLFSIGYKTGTEGEHI